MPEMTDFERRYLDRLRARARQVLKDAAENQSEGSSGWTSAHEGQFNSRWDGMSLAEALQDARNTGYMPNLFAEIDVDEDDPAIQQFVSQFGAERQYVDADGKPMQRPDSNNAVARGFVMGYGDPTYSEGSDEELLQDGSRILRLPDGRYIREAGNLNGETIAGAHRQRETDYRRMRQRARVATAVLVTGGLAAGALGGAGAGLGAAEAGAVGLGASEIGTAAAAGAGAGAGAGVGAGLGAAEVGLGASEIGTAAAAGAPAVAAPLTAAPVITPAATTTPGIIDGARGALSSVGNWYNGLTPAGRFVLGQAVSGGIQALSGAAAQREAQQNADEQQRQQEEDRIRRTNVTAFRPGAIVARPGAPRGIVASRRRGG